MKNIFKNNKKVILLSLGIVAVLVILVGSYSYSKYSYMTNEENKIIETFTEKVTSLEATEESSNDDMISNINSLREVENEFKAMEEPSVYKDSSIKMYFYRVVKDEERRDEIYSKISEIILTQTEAITSNVTESVEGLNVDYSKMSKDDVNSNVEKLNNNKSFIEENGDYLTEGASEELLSTIEEAKKNAQSRLDTIKKEEEEKAKAEAEKKAAEEAAAAAQSNSYSYNSGSSSSSSYNSGSSSYNSSSNSGGSSSGGSSSGGGLPKPSNINSAGGVYTVNVANCKYYISQNMLNAWGRVSYPTDCGGTLVYYSDATCSHVQYSNFGQTYAGVGKNIFC